MADVERPFEPDHFNGHPVVGSLFNPDSMETFRSSPEQKARLPKSTLTSKLDKEARRQKKDKERSRLHQEVKDRLYEELREHESIQSQLHGARDSIERKRAYADSAEKEIRKLDLLLSAGSLKEDQLAVELAKLQVELSAYQSKLEGAKQELQRAQDLTEELTTDRNKAKDEAHELREERRKAAEQRRLDAARREGMMQGKLEGMYAGWEDGKIMGYREGRKKGAHVQHGEMVNKDWKILQRELPEYDRFEDRIPSPISTFIGDVPEPLRELPAPIILPPAPKKPPRPAPPPETVYHNDDEYFPQPVHSSPETTQRNIPPISQPSTRGRSQRPTNAPMTAQSEREPRARSHTRTNIPPPRPIFGHEGGAWEPPPSRPEVLQRSTTQRAIGVIGNKIKRKHEDIVPAPEHMDFAPFAVSLPYPSVATPLPQSRTMMPGRAVLTPAPSIYGRDRDSEEEFDRDMERQRAQRQEEDRPQNKGSFLSRINTALRGGLSQPAIDPSSHPLAYQDAHSTPHLLRLDTSMSPSPSPSPLPSPGRRSIQLSAPIPIPTPAPVWPPPPSPRHPRPAFQDASVPALDAQGTIILPPPHGVEGSAMESAINLIQSRNPSRNPSPTPSNRSNQRPRSRPRSRDPSRDPSPSGRLSNLGGSLRQAASGVIHAVPSRGRIRDGFRGRSRSASRSPDADPIRMARERSRERERSRSPMRPRSSFGVPNAFVDVPEDGLLRPEDIRVGPSVSGTTVSEMDNASMMRSRGGRKGTAMSQNSGRTSPGGMSILSNGALGLSRGDRDAGYVTYPAATLSAANLSMIEEERNRQSGGYNPSPSPNFRQPAQYNVPVDSSDVFPPRPPGSQRHYSDNDPRGHDDGRGPWDLNSQYPPPAASIRSQRSHASTVAPPPPVKSPRAGPYPWATRPVPAVITMPPLLSAQSPTSSSRGGIAGIGAGGGFHKRAMSASALSPGPGPPHHSFASPIPPNPARLSMAGSFAGSDTGRPPIAPKPQPPSSRRNPIILDDPPTEGTPYQHPGHAATRSWSGEKQQISRTIPSRSRRNSAAVRNPDFMGGQTLVTVEEHRSPYMQGPEEGRRSTGSLISVHSNRLQYDPAYAIQSDLTAALEKEVGQPRQSSDEGPVPKVARPSVSKRVSKVLKFGGKKGK